MKYLFIYLLFGFLSFQGNYSFKSNAEKSEQIFNDIGRQFMNGLRSTLDDDFQENIDLDVTSQKSYVEREDLFHPTVTVEPLGTAVGTVMKTYTGKPFYSFSGIRFATAGTFEMPQINEEPWEENFMGGFDATYVRPKCPQLSLFFPVPTGDEDCLFLNVFTPELDEVNPTKKHPVMVFIYGGGYTIGDTTLYTPSRLIEEDVVVVVLQYRLGTLGFLYSATTSAPGNMGLMDQVTALRWVKKYIQYFNGDEENITVFGESAGGASTSWMQFTPQNSAEYNNGNQLLNRVIIESGSVLEMWTLDLFYEKAIILHGEATGCYEELDTPDDIVSCMKELSSDELVRASLQVTADSFGEGDVAFYGVVPVIQDALLNSLEDESLIREYIVIPADPTYMAENGQFLHVDVMGGSNRDEGSLIVGGAYVGFLEPNGLTTDEHFLKHEAMPLIVKSFGINDVTGAVANAFRLAFLPNVEMGNATQMVGGLIDLSGMGTLKTGLWELIKMQTTSNPDNNIFIYSFEFESADSLFDWFFFSNPEIPFSGGVAHGDELLYLFALPSNPGDREKQTIKRMCTLWANFAKYGDPTPDSDPDSWQDLTEKWLPYSFERENILLMMDDFVQSEDLVLRWNYNMLH